MNGIDPRSRDWRPWALAVLYGPEHRRSDPFPAFQRALGELLAAAADARATAVEKALGADLVEDLLPALDNLETSSRHRDEIAAPLKVVLMGRTQAGKSTILATLSGASFDRIGDGRQRFSRDVFGAVPLELPEIEIVDTPGVGARDGLGDFDLAIAEALTADLILWVASSDSIQEETAKALRLLGFLGKPLLVAVNCMKRTDTAKGRDDLLHYPERVFGGKDDHVREIERHLAASGAMPTGVVLIHAKSAAEFVRRGRTDAGLYQASRFHLLVDSLRDEHNSRADTRKLIRRADDVRRVAAGLEQQLRAGATQLDFTAQINREIAADALQRLRREQRMSHEALLSKVKRLVDQRRDWHLSVTDFGKGLEDAWTKEVKALHAEVTDAVSAAVEDLNRQMEALASRAQDAWSKLPPSQTDMSGLAGFNDVWKNRWGVPTILDSDSRSGRICSCQRSVGGTSAASASSPT